VEPFAVCRCRSSAGGGDSWRFVRLSDGRGAPLPAIEPQTSLRDSAGIGPYSCKLNHGRQGKSFAGRPGASASLSLVDEAYAYIFAFSRVYIFIRITVWRQSAQSPLARLIA
jgi:hypothetical protein